VAVGAGCFLRFMRKEFFLLAEESRPRAEVGGEFAF
jgi:hypothetical protein